MQNSQMVARGGVGGRASTKSVNMEVRIHVGYVLTPENHDNLCFLRLFTKSTCWSTGAEYIRMMQEGYWNKVCLIVVQNFG